MIFFQDDASPSIFFASHCSAILFKTVVGTGDCHKKSGFLLCHLVKSDKIAAVHFLVTGMLSRKIFQIPLTRDFVVV